ncbi:hypothetical protein NL676_027715 [Syzygium grande]|nr:hypothetical protein NL676_027715 [Syzygium grande]
MNQSNRATAWWGGRTSRGHAISRGGGRVDQKEGKWDCYFNDGGESETCVCDWVVASLRHGKDDSFGERELWEAAAVVSRRRRISVENGEDGS